MPASNSGPMSIRRAIAAVLAGVLVSALLAPPAPASEAMRERLAQWSGGRLHRPRVLSLEGLTFGTIAPLAGDARGTVVIDPVSGRKRVHGGLIDLGGRDGPSLFEIRGRPNARFVILLPDEVRLAGRGAGAIRLHRFTSSPPRVGRLDRHGRARVRVGATLSVPPRQRPRRYRGRFELIVHYE